jgi:hypothetical protein
LAELGNIRADQGRYAEAEPLYRRALAILERALGSDHAPGGTTGTPRPSGCSGRLGRSDA